MLVHVLQVGVEGGRREAEAGRRLSLGVGDLSRCLQRNKNRLRWSRRRSIYLTADAHHPQAWESSQSQSRCAAVRSCGLNPLEDAVQHESNECLLDK